MISRRGYLWGFCSAMQEALVPRILDGNVRILQYAHEADRNSDLIRRLASSLIIIHRIETFLNAYKRAVCAPRWVSRRRKRLLISGVCGTWPIIICIKLEYVLDGRRDNFLPRIPVIHGAFVMGLSHQREHGFMGPRFVLIK